MKRLYAALIAAVLLIASGCSIKGKKAEVKEAVDKDKTLVVWSFTNDLQRVAEEYYVATHPDMKEEGAFVPTDQFESKLDPVLANGDGAPDVFGLEEAFVRKYVESGKLMELDDVYQEVKDKMTDYPMKVGSNNGHVYAMSWQITLGAVFYRRSLAQKYLGTDDPDEVQKRTADPKKFIETAKLLKEKSDGKCLIVSSMFDM